MSGDAFATGLGTAAAFAITAFSLTALALLLFMALVQPIWCIVDCAVDRSRGTAGKVLWILALVLLYGIANWFYGAFAAAGRWLRRLSRLAWLFAILLVIAVVTMYNAHDGFRRELDREWQRGRQMMVTAPPAPAGRCPTASA
jgi:hypothetical protein